MQLIRRQVSREGASALIPQTLAALLASAERVYRIFENSKVNINDAWTVFESVSSIARELTLQVIYGRPLLSNEVVDLRSVCKYLRRTLERDAEERSENSEYLDAMNEAYYAVYSLSRVSFEKTFEEFLIDPNDEAQAIEEIDQKYDSRGLRE